MKIKKKKSSVASIENLKALKYHIFSIKHEFFLSFVINVAVKMKKHLKKKNQLRHLKVFGLIRNTEVHQINI